MSEIEDDSTTIGLPQLIVAAVLGFIIIRWFISTPSSPNAATGQPVAAAGGGRAGATRSGRRVSPAMIEVVQTMFPQVSAAAIRQELERNGGSVEAVTDRILAEGSLPEPPQPRVAASSSSNTIRPSSTSTPTMTPAAAATSSKPLHTDLLTRYNLNERLKSYVPEVEDKTKGKAAVKNDRASLLLRGRARRDEMILAARKRMEEMITEGKIKRDE